MTIQKNIDLLPYNTFKVPARAKYFAVAKTSADLKNLPDEKILILGEGANVLFTKDFEGLVVKNEIKGRKEIPGQARNDKIFRGIYLICSLPSTKEIFIVLP